jgi:pimeloyl-ACP methyl ester carboxylesterase
MRAAFAQFLAFPRDVEDNQASMATQLPMPVLAIVGEKPFGATQAVVMRNAATNVTEVVIPQAGHWLMEQPSPPQTPLVNSTMPGKVVVHMTFEVQRG